MPQQIIVIDDEAHGQSIELALTIEEEIAGRDASTVIFALCWVLASLMIQAEEQKDLPTTKSIELISDQLASCVGRLRDRGPQIH